jgi:hypothetical protein
MTTVTDPKVIASRDLITENFEYYINPASNGFPSTTPTLVGWPFYWEQSTNSWNFGYGLNLNLNKELGESIIERPIPN